MCAYVWGTGLVSLSEMSMLRHMKQVQQCHNTACGHTHRYKQTHEGTDAHAIDR